MIPYFAVGVAGTAIRMLAGKNHLLSFAYIGTNFCSERDAEQLRAESGRSFLDSGAFTAWKSGRPIVLADYVAYVRDHGTAYTSIAALDDITSHETSAANYRTMCAAVPLIADRIVPVFHEGEPIELLDRYVDDAAIIGIGRTEGRRSKDKTLALYDAVFNRHHGHAFHAFGNGDPQTLEPYPFHSFDCTTWERDSAYANKHGWPWSRCEKETRQRAYIEAMETIRHRPVRDLFSMGRTRTP